MNYISVAISIFLIAGQLTMSSSNSLAQTAPSKSEIATYRSLHKAAHMGNLTMLGEFIKQGADLEGRDSAGRTPLHVAAFASQKKIVRELAKAGADLNALENSAYDIVTIAAVANDLEMVDLALNLGANAKNITSPYDGTALIAAAHLGHDSVVKRLIKSGAPLDHINNIGWTALLEAIILGDGGARHIKIVQALLEAGADKSIADKEGVTPLQHAKSHQYAGMIKLLI